MGAHPLKGFGIGIMVGLVLAGSVPAFASFGWVAGSTLQNANRNFQLGYAAGVDDAVQAIVNSGAPVTDVKHTAGCFAKHHSSLGLGPFADWALTLPRRDQTVAAGRMIQRACE